MFKYHANYAFPHLSTFQVLTTYFLSKLFDNISYDAHYKVCDQYYL